MIAAEPRDLFLDLPDRRLRARWIEPGGDAHPAQYAPTLVFLHEGLGCIELWRTFPAALSTRTGLRGLVYDRTGYGQSSGWPEAPGPRYLAIEAERVLPELLDAARIETCLLVGHGDGGTIALRLAAAQPPLLRGVVAIGAHAIREARTVASMQQAHDAFRSTTLREQLARYHGAQTDAMFARWTEAWLSPDAPPADLAGHLPRVRVPVLALRGEHDEYGTVSQLHAIARGVSGRCETRQMPGCGYAPHLQDEETVVEAVARFIATLWRGPAESTARSAGAVLLAAAVSCAWPASVFAQADPCTAPAAATVLADARRLLDRVDDAAAAEGLRLAAAAGSECHEIGVAALATAGWVEARRLALVGGAPDELGRVRDTLARLETVRATRAPTALLAQQAAYAEAVLRAAAAAAQDERDEMRAYLVHARPLADSLALARAGRPWPLPLALVEGELWLEVDRFAEARDAFVRLDDPALEGRRSLGLGRALERLGDRAAACAALITAEAGGLAGQAREMVSAASARLACPRK